MTIEARPTGFAHVAMNDFPESDWKKFRKIHDDALDRFCRRVLDEVAAIVADKSRSHHERYLAVYRVMQKRDRVIAEAFPGPRRSRAWTDLTALVLRNLVGPEDLRPLSEATRQRLEDIVAIIKE